MRLTMLALVASITTTRTRRGSFPTTDQTAKCITAGRPTLAMHRRAFHPTSLPPNVRAVRRVSETLRRQRGGFPNLRPSALHCAGCSGDLPPPSPPAEKATARQDQAGKSSTGDGACPRRSCASPRAAMHRETKKAPGGPGLEVTKHLEGEL